MSEVAQKEQQQPQQAKVIPIREGISTEPAIRRPPAQLNLFTGKPEPVRIPVDEEPDAVEIPLDKGVVLVQSGDKSQLVVSGFGIFVGKVSERVTVKTPDKNRRVVFEVPFFRLSELIVASRGVSISSDVIEELCRRGIPIHFLQSNGRPYAQVSSPALTATVRTRREQMEALKDGRSFKISRAIVEAKMSNQAGLLRYFAKYLQQASPPRFERITKLAGEIRALAGKVKSNEAKDIEEGRSTLMGFEGTAGRLYWEGVKEIVEEKATFLGRVTRGATDVMNALLNYGYGILYTQVWGAVTLAGLEPFAGFLHVDRPGKPSLVLDLIEEFRQPVVDRTVIASINLGKSFNMEGGLLDADSRKGIAEKILERLEARETYEGKKYQVRSIIQIQARRLAGFLREEREYKPYRFKW